MDKEGFVISPEVLSSFIFWGCILVFKMAAMRCSIWRGGFTTCAKIGFCAQPVNFEASTDEEELRQRRGRQEVGRRLQGGGR